MSALLCLCRLYTPHRTPHQIHATEQACRNTCKPILLLIKSIPTNILCFPLYHLYLSFFYNNVVITFPVPLITLYIILFLHIDYDNITFTSLHFFNSILLTSSIEID